MESGRHADAHQRRRKRANGPRICRESECVYGPRGIFAPNFEGVSILDGDGELFCDREADAAFFHALKAHLRSDIPVYEAELNINDPAFSARAVELLLGLMSEGA